MRFQDSIAPLLAVGSLLLGATSVAAQGGPGGRGGDCIFSGINYGTVNCIAGSGGNGGDAIYGPAQRVRPTWFVIAGSWPSDDVLKANARVNSLSTNGISARVVNTDKYPKLAPGLSAVVLGPFSKDQARAHLGTVQANVPDAYMKEAY